MSHEERAELWGSRISDYRASGEQVATWCARHQVTPKQFYYWMRKLKKAAQQTPAARGPKWVSVSVEQQITDNEASPIVVKVGTVAVEVRAGFEPSVFAAVVRTLKALC